MAAKFPLVFVLKPPLGVWGQVLAHKCSKPYSNADLTVNGNHPNPSLSRRGANSHAVFCIGSPPILGGVRGGKSAYSWYFQHVSNTYGSGLYFMQIMQIY
jgi:hypothetical protein